jgi:hypothetical protein
VGGCGREEGKVENKKNLRKVQSSNCHMSKSSRDGLFVRFWREKLSV